MALIDGFDKFDAYGRVYRQVLVEDLELTGGQIYEIPESERAPLDVTRDTHFFIWAEVTPASGYSGGLRLYWEVKAWEDWFPQVGDPMELSLEAGVVCAYDYLDVGDSPYARLWKIQNLDPNNVVTVDRLLILYKDSRRY